MAKSNMKVYMRTVGSATPRMSSGWPPSREWIRPQREVDARVWTAVSTPSASRIAAGQMREKHMCIYIYIDAYIHTFILTCIALELLAEGNDGDGGGEENVGGGREDAEAGAEAAGPVLAVAGEAAAEVVADAAKGHEGFFHERVSNWRNEYTINWEIPEVEEERREENSSYMMDDGFQRKERGAGLLVYLISLARENGKYNIIKMRGEGRS